MFKNQSLKWSWEERWKKAGMLQMVLYIFFQTGWLSYLQEQAGFFTLQLIMFGWTDKI